jgi:hypothetical protein
LVFFSGDTEEESTEAASASSIERRQRGHVRRGLGEQRVLLIGAAVDGDAARHLVVLVCVRPHSSPHRHSRRSKYTADRYDSASLTAATASAA